MKKVILSGKEYTLWESWQEIPAKQLPEILRLLYASPANGESYHEILRIILGYRKHDWEKLMRHYFGTHRSEAVRQANAEVLSDLLLTVSWMWKTDLTVRPFESVMVEGIEHILPVDGFEKLAYGELTDAYIHLRAYLDQLIEGEERLHYLMAVLCRPRLDGDYTSEVGWNGDHRQPYNKHLIKRRASAWESVDYATKVSILVWFVGSLKDFLSHFEIWDDSPTPTKEDDYPGQSWIKNQHLLSEKQIFGGMAQTEAANVYDVFQFLEEYTKDQIAKRKAQQNNDSN